MWCQIWWILPVEAMHMPTYLLYILFQLLRAWTALYVLFNCILLHFCCIFVDFCCILYCFSRSQETAIWGLSKTFPPPAKGLALARILPRPLKAPRARHRSPKILESISQTESMDLYYEGFMVSIWINSLWLRLWCALECLIEPFFQKNRSFSLKCLQKPPKSENFEVKCSSQDIRQSL